MMCPSNHRSRWLPTLLCVGVAALLLLPDSFSLSVSVASANDDDDDDEEMTFEADDTSKKPAEPAPDEPEIEMGDDDDDTGGGEPEPEPELEPEPGDGAVDGTKNAKEAKLGENRVSWQDIVVVVRKPFLKTGRVELLPTWGVTMNDNIIQHIQFAGQLNYYLTDVLAVGLEGHLYVKNLREPFDLVARQARRLPTVNKYNYGAALNFHYVPVYGKFALWTDKIIHWEAFFTAGVGFTQSEVIPRDPALQSFTNFLITPNIGTSMRFFITKFLTVNVGIRDYVFIDRFEAASRTEISGAAAKDNADSALINNVVFQVGISFWLPTSFEYTTFR